MGDRGISWKLGFIDAHHDETGCGAGGYAADDSAS